MKAGWVFVGLMLAAGCAHPLTGARAEASVSQHPIPESRPMPTDTSKCRPAGSWSRNTLANLQAIVTGADSGNAHLRKAFDLPHVTTIPAVEHVVDELECARAARAVAAQWVDSLSPLPVWVFRIGTTRVGVSDGRPGGRGNILVHIFDNNYSYLLSID